MLNLVSRDQSLLDELLLNLGYVRPVELTRRFTEGDRLVGISSDIDKAQFQEEPR